MTILDQLAGHARERVAASKSAVPLEELRRQALSLPKGDFGFEKALRKDGLSFICECKRASPSKGLIAPEYPYLQIALDYEAAGADCISVLTEPKWFLGSGRHLQEIARTAREYGLDIPEDFSLITLGRSSRESELDFTTINSRRDRVAHYAVRLVKEHFEQVKNAPTHYIITPEIHFGKTVKNINVPQPGKAGK